MLKMPTPDNATGVSIAAVVLYPFVAILLSSMITGAAMSFSSASAISNVLRLLDVTI